MTTGIAMTASELVLVDSSGWLEYITGDEKADAFGAVLQSDVQVLVPTIVLYEVLKILLLRAGKSDADVFLSEALRRKVRPHGYNCSGCCHAEHLPQTADGR